MALALQERKGDKHWDDKRMAQSRLDAQERDAQAPGHVLDRWHLNRGSGAFAARDEIRLCGAPKTIVSNNMQAAAAGDGSSAETHGQSDPELAGRELAALSQQQQDMEQLEDAAAGMQIEAAIEADKVDAALLVIADSIACAEPPAAAAQGKEHGHTANEAQGKKWWRSLPSWIKLKRA